MPDAPPITRKDGKLRPLAIAHAPAPLVIAEVETRLSDVWYGPLPHALSVMPAPVAGIHGIGGTPETQKM